MALSLIIDLSLSKHTGCVSNDDRTPHMPDEYDQMIRGVIPYYGEIHAEIINLVRSLENEPKVWLDTGCGTGSLIAKAMQVFAGTKFVLADPSALMLDRAKAKFVEEGRTVILPAAKTQELRAIFHGKADVITAVQCHHYQANDERRQAVRTCYDLLEGGGLFVNTENIRPLTQEGVRLGKEYWGLYQRDFGRNDEDIANHLSRFDKEYFPITIEQHLELLRGTGFRTVEMFWYSYLQAGFYAIK